MELSKKMKIYFAGSIRGGRDDADLYMKIIEHLQKYGDVLTEHVGSKEIDQGGEKLAEEEIYQRDMDWLTSADIVVAEVTTPSLGVGFEIAKALESGKKILCLFRKDSGRSLSAMISGCKELEVVSYGNLDEAIESIREFIEG